MLNTLMSNEDTENKCKECDDPCDDCTDMHMSNLTGWITSQKDKEDLDKTSEK
jgi:hypothetical protein